MIDPLDPLLDPYALPDAPAATIPQPTTPDPVAPPPDLNSSGVITEPSAEPLAPAPLQPVETPEAMQARQFAENLAGDEAYNFINGGAPPSYWGAGPVTDPGMVAQEQVAAPVLDIAQPQITGPVEDISQVAPEAPAPPPQQAPPPKAVADMSPQEIAAMRDDQLALEIEKKKIEAEDFAREEGAKLARRDELTRETNLFLKNEAERRVTESAKRLDDNLMAIAEKGIDPDQWRNSRSTFQNIMSYIAVFAGGLTQHATGRNIGLELINRAIDNDIAAQQTQMTAKVDAIGKQRNTLAQVRENARDEHEARETMRIAAYQQAANEIQSQMLKLAPNGTSAMRLGLILKETQAQAAAARNAYLERERKIGMEDAEFVLKLRKDERESEAALLAARKAAGMGGGGRVKEVSEDDMPMPREHWKKVAPHLELPPELGDSPTRKQVLAFAALTEKTVSAAAAQNKGIVNNPVTGEPLTQPDGSKFRVDGRSETAINEVNAQMTGTTNIASMLDEMSHLTGWNRETLGGEDVAKIKQNQKLITAALKDALKLGAMSQGEYDMVDDIMFGGRNPNGWRDVKGLLMRAKDHLVSQTNTSLRNLGYKGKWEPVDMGYRKAGRKKTDTEKKYEEYIEGGVSRVGSAAMPDYSKMSPAEAKKAAAEYVASRNKEISARQAREDAVPAELVDKALNGATEKEREEAYAVLEQMTKEADGRRLENAQRAFALLQSEISKRALDAKMPAEEIR